MKLSSLLRELEALERDGYGQCDVEVFPEMAPDEGLATYFLDFASIAYRLTAVRLPGEQHEGCVTLYFAAVVGQ